MREYLIRSPRLKWGAKSEADGAQATVAPELAQEKPREVPREKPEVCGEKPTLPSRLKAERRRRQKLEAVLSGLGQALRDEQDRLGQIGVELERVRGASCTLSEAVKAMVVAESEMRNQLLKITRELSVVSEGGSHGLLSAEVLEDLTRPCREGDVSGAASAGDTGGLADPVSPEGTCVLYGSLEQLPVADVLQFARWLRKTGKVKILSEKASGFIHLIEGEAVYAKTDKEEGFQAFTDLLGAESGHLEFVSRGVDAGLQNLSRGTIPLLMEALRLLDERDSQLRR